VIERKSLARDEHESAHDEYESSRHRSTAGDRFRAVLLATCAAVVAVGCGQAAPQSGSATKPAVGVTAAPRAPVPTLDPVTEANASWKTLVGVATLPNIFDAPVGVAVDSLGVLYVSDVTQHRLLRFDSVTGRFEGMLGSAGTGQLQFQAPMGLAIDSQDNVYVAERGGNRIQIFDRQGGFIGQFGGEGDGPTEVRLPAGLAVSPHNGTLYVADTENNRVVRYSPTSPDPMPLGQKGSGPDQFLSPGGVAIDKAGNVFVADTGNKRILRLAAH